MAGVWVREASNKIWDPLFISATVEASKLATSNLVHNSLPKTTFNNNQKSKCITSEAMQYRQAMCRIPSAILTKQEAQLSQRDRATLRVIEYFAKSLKITQGHSK